LAAVTAAGGLLGVIIGGVGGRLAMFVLAAVNPEAAGVESDDGFVMGRFTMSGTLNLLLLGVFAGVLGGGIYYVLRGLMIGPRWFGILSMSGGAAVVVGSMLVHSDGVDFTLLSPTYVPIAMFVAIPGFFVVILTLVAEPLLGPEAWFMRAPRPVAFAPLLLWIPLAPLLAAIVVGWVIGACLRQFESFQELLARPLLPWMARLALTVFFVERFLALTRDVTVLT